MISALYFKATINPFLVCPVMGQISYPFYSLCVFLLHLVYFLNGQIIFFPHRIDLGLCSLQRKTSQRFRHVNHLVIYNRTISLWLTHTHLFSSDSRPIFVLNFVILFLAYLIWVDFFSSISSRSLVFPYLDAIIQEFLSKISTSKLFLSLTE